MRTEKEEELFEKSIATLKEMIKNKEINEQQYNDMLMDIQLRRKKVLEEE